MNGIINNLITALNNTGRAFCDFSIAMFIQASVLIVLLFVIDILIRKRVRATFRYCIWMLVFIKLILPPALSLPTGIGNWFGEYFVVSSENIDRRAENIEQESSISAESFGTEFSPQQVRDFQNFSRTDTPRITETQEVSTAPQSIEPDISSANSITWQGGIFLIWLVGVLVLLVLLIQRIFFVKGLIAQSEPAKNRLLDTLQECSAQLGIKRNIQMKLSHNASSPAVCGLFKPVILIPANLLSKISHEKFKAILIHELSHIKRNDLLVNCAQTILQILYFYNPLVWLANSIVRKIREQAVDEMVLVALGAEAKSYTTTLIDVAEMAFSRPALSLRLVGVVESKKALSQRIKHILNRPFPKSAKLGMLGIFVVIIIAAILLPMAKAQSRNQNRIAWYDTKTLLKFNSQDQLNGTHRTEGDTKIYSKNYDVVFRKGEKLLVFAELYETGKPMRRLGHKIFDGSDKPQKLIASLIEKSSKQINNSQLQDINYQIQVQLGEVKFYVSTNIATPADSIGGAWGWFQGDKISTYKINDKIPACRFYTLLKYFRDTKKSNEDCNIWIPNDRIYEIGKYKQIIELRMVPLSQIEYILNDIGPMGGYQLPDGSLLQGNGFNAKNIREQYMQSIMSMLAPLPKLTAHKYYKRDEPIAIKAEQVNSGQWKPTLDELDKSGNLCFYLIDGQEYDSRLGFGPFGTGGMNLNIPSDLYVDLKLPSDKHTVAFGWRNIDVINPEEPKKTVHFNRLATEPVEFEVVSEIPDDYYSEVYEDGWDKIFAENIEVQFTDDIRKLRCAGALLVLVVKSLPFEIAFDIYAQAEGSEEREYVTQIARKANMPGNYIVACDHNIESLNWENVGQKRYRLILVPSVKAAIANPPVHNYYGREYITDWVTFEKSELFDQHYQSQIKREESKKIQRYGGTIKNDKPVDLDRLDRRWTGDSNESQPPDGFELGWSSEKGGILKINPDSNVRMLWFPEANASLIDPDAKTKARLVELPESKTTEINPPKGERTLIAVRSDEGKVYFVQVSKVNEQWANLSWWQHEEPQSKDFKATLPNGVTVELLGICEHPSEGKQWWKPDGTLLVQRPYDQLKITPIPDAKSDEKVYEFAYRMSKGMDSGTIFVTGEIIEHSGYAIGPYKNGEPVGDIRSHVSYLPKDQEVTTITISSAVFKNVSLRPGVKTDVQIETEKHSATEVSENRINIEVGDERLVATNRPWPVKTDLPKDVIGKRDQLLFHTDKTIRTGLIELSKQFPVLKNARDWNEVITEQSGTGQINISLFHTDQGKAQTTQVPVSERDRFSVLVVISTPPAQIVQMAMFDLYPDLGLVGQFGTSSGDPKLDSALKKLITEALEPLKQFNGEIKTEYSKIEMQNDTNRKHISLEFRIAPDSVTSSRVPSPLTPEEEKKYKDDLLKNGHEAGIERNDEYIWLPVRDDTQLGFLVSEEYNGKKYLLVSNKKSNIMLSDGSWNVEKASITKYSDGRFAGISLQLDEKGGENFFQLTSNNIRKALAAIIDGKVISAPVIQSAIGREVMITGIFTEEEANSIISIINGSVSD